MSVTEPSYAVKRRNGQQTGGRRLALRASLRPQLTLWLGLAWLGSSLKVETVAHIRSLYITDCVFYNVITRIHL